MTPRDREFLYDLAELFATEITLSTDLSSRRKVFKQKWGIK